MMIEEIDRHCIELGRYGFTIPYLYMIEKDANREKSILEIIIFLSEAPKSYLISYCNDLDEFIIGLPKTENAPIDMYENFGNLYYDEDVLGKFESIFALADFLYSEYQTMIDNGTFSKNIKTKIWE